MSSQCVPSWDLEDPPNPSPHLQLLSSNSTHPQLPMLDYEVAELTWENGHLATHGLGHPRVGKPVPKYPSTATTGTLESVVNQAKLLPPFLPATKPHHRHIHLHHLPVVDALVPTAGARRHDRTDLASGIGSCDTSGIGGRRRKRARAGDVGGSPDSIGGADTDEFGFTTTNSGTPFPEDGLGGGSPDTENTSFGGRGGASRALTGADDLDSACHSRRSQSQLQRKAVGEEEEKATQGDTMRSAISTKRSRAAAIHNQSERRRRDRIKQRMRTLQKLVPSSSKTDKASMLDEVIEYLKQLQAQVQMMSRMNSMSPMMMPMGMQQLQMSMMAQMAHMAQMAQMGMGLGMMDMGSLGRPGHPGIPTVVPPPAFLPTVGGPWDTATVAAAAAADRMQQPGSTIIPDPFSTLHACPPQQQMSMDAYQRMSSMYQQMFQLNPPANPK